MNGSQTITEQDLSRIREKINLTGRRGSRHRKRAKLTATFGHIGFCLGLLLAGTYIFYMMMGSKIEQGVAEFPQWYATIGQTLRGVVPAFAADTVLEFVIVAAMPLLGSFVFALLGKIFGLFASGNYYSLSSSNAPPRKQAEKLLEDIERAYSGYLTYDDHYPSSDHMINLYNFIPWLFFITSFVFGFLVFTTTESKEEFLGIVMVIPLLFLGPIALLWRLSAIIDSVFYRGSSGYYLSTEKKQLEEFIAQCDKKEQEKKERIKQQQRAERLKKAEELYQKAIASEETDMKLIKQAADMEHPEACLRYALEMLSGLNPSAQTRSEMNEINEEAADYLEIPAKQGNKEAKFYWLICRCQYESGDVDDWQEMLDSLRELKAGGHVPSHMQGVCDIAIENAVQCINSLESRSYSYTYSTSYTEPLKEEEPWDGAGPDALPWGTGMVDCSDL